MAESQTNKLIRILNDEETKEPGAILQALELSRQMQRLILKMKGDFMDSDGKGVDYNSLKGSALFQDYIRKARELKFVDLWGTLDIYNALTIHGLASQVGANLPNSVLEITNFWKKTAYNIGGFVLTLDDIEHGILRANKPHPSSPEPLFNLNDPRLQLTLPCLDPRIHFALVCGAKSCPAINVYSAKNLDAGLTAAAKSFITQEVFLSDGVVTLSKIFNWYKGDFATDTVGLLRWIAQYSQPTDKEQIEELLKNGEEAIQLQWKDYNWKLNKL
ncbi:predicted protein [Nematostella vectensis]|uniref:DUF547 domain-containing protein n=1 Tax=Nematostella vectensis TaxID=45351 RepID=A7S7K0_NEMVE|nr:predicted protein [Nematostella vectensis]|eukprot:XP_001632383.1 predicted protein [Nematostella vectensis]